MAEDGRVATKLVKKGTDYGGPALIQHACTGGGCDG